MIVQLPCTWQNYMEQNYDLAFSNEYVRVGWYYSTLNGENRKYTAALKIDTSQLAGISQYRVRDPRLVMYSTNAVTTPFQMRIRRLLKPVAQGMTWIRYDGVNNWTSPGGESAGNDYSTEVICDLTPASLPAPGTIEFPISASSLLTIAANNSPLIIFPPVTSPSPGNAIVYSFTRNLAYTYIEFDLRSGLSGDATIF